MFNPKKKNNYFGINLELLVDHREEDIVLDSPGAHHGHYHLQEESVHSAVTNRDQLTKINNFHSQSIIFSSSII